MASYQLKSTIKNSQTDIICIYGSKEMKCVKHSAEQLKKLASTFKDNRI